jgi:hypothetical protein
MGKRAPKRIKRGTTWATVKRWALALDGAAEGTYYGRPSILAYGKFLTRQRAEDKAIVLSTGTMDERDWLITNEPDAFFVDDHYRPYPAVLVRLDWVDPLAVKEMLEARWNRIRPKAKGLRPKSGT